MSEQPRVRFVPIRKNVLWHIAKDTAVAEHAFDRSPLCGRVQGEFHVRTTPTSRWGDDPLQWKVEGITCQTCVRRYQKRVAS